MIQAEESDGDSSRTFAVRRFHPRARSVDIRTRCDSGDSSGPGATCVDV